jgi:hypothetical protein
VTIRVGVLEIPEFIALKNRVNSYEKQKDPNVNFNEIEVMRKKLRAQELFNLEKEDFNRRRLHG